MEQFRLSVAADPTLLARAAFAAASRAAASKLKAPQDAGKALDALYAAARAEPSHGGGQLALGKLLQDQGLFAEAKAALEASGAEGKAARASFDAALGRKMTDLEAELSLGDSPDVPLQLGQV